MIEQFLNKIKKDIKDKIKSEDINDENLYNLHYLYFCIY